MIGQIFANTPQVSHHPDAKIAQMLCPADT